MVKTLIEKYGKYLLNVLIDVLCIFGVLYLGWDVLSLMLFYWLDVALMILFLIIYMVIIRKAWFNLEIIPATIMIYAMMYGYYKLMINFAVAKGYHAEQEFLMAFKPPWMLPVFLVTAALSNYREFRFYYNQLPDKTKDHFIYPKLWTIKLVAVQALLFGAMAVEANSLITILLIITVKWLLIAWRQWQDNKNAN